MTEAAPQLTEEQKKQLEEKLKNMSPEELQEFQKQQCIFCQIISGKVPAKKVYEDEQCIVILDINPAAKGHLLLMPKEHYAIMPQLSDKQIAHFFLVAKKLSQILLKALKVTGTNIFIANGLVAGQRAQHFIIHIIPRREGDGVLNIEEKFLDKGLQQKTITAVQNKLNELLGVKKEIINLPEKEENIKEEPSEDEETEPESQEEPAEDLVEEDSKNKIDKSDEAADKEESSTEDNGSKEKKDVSLDDIANLFK